MQIEMSQRQLELLTQLVDSRVSELHPQIRRSRTHTYHDQLQEDLDVLRELHQRLQEASGAQQEQDES